MNNQPGIYLLVTHNNFEVVRMDQWGNKNHLGSGYTVDEALRNARYNSPGDLVVQLAVAS